MWGISSLCLSGSWFFSWIWNQMVIFHTDGRLSGSDEGASDILRMRWEVERCFMNLGWFHVSPTSVYLSAKHQNENKIKLPKLTLWPFSRNRLLKISKHGSEKPQPTLAPHQNRLFLTNSRCREARPKGWFVLRCLFNFNAVILMDFLFSLLQKEWNKPGVK